jgi:hypothetical protein
MRFVVLLTLIVILLCQLESVQVTVAAVEQALKLVSDSFVER